MGPVARQKRANEGGCSLDEIEASPLASRTVSRRTSSGSAAGDRCSSTEAVLRDGSVDASLTVGLDEEQCQGRLRIDPVAPVEN
jgi:hypothetical protein